METTVNPGKCSILSNVEKVLSISSLAIHPEYLSALDEEGYMPISFLVSQPPLCDSDVDIRSLIEFLASCPEYALSSDSSLVRLAIPMNRHTIILRDVPEEATKEDILHLVDNPAVNLRKEVDSIWFVDYPTESSALEAIDRLQNSTLLGSPVRARVKGAMYMKELYKQLNSRTPDRRLSTDAAAFVPELVSKKISSDAAEKASMSTTEIMPTAESPSRKLSSDAAEFTPTHRMSVDASPFVPTASPSTFLWGYPGLSNGLDFGYCGSSLPLVITASGGNGYKAEFRRYSSDDLYDIVRKAKDLTLPEVSKEVMSLGIISEKANTDLVEKGRTMSIDQALRERAPRTWSVDSCDYISMMTGYPSESLRQKR
ncbi:hypothetical protein WA588_005345, partial [Blastocystis sp. NMH]